MGTRFLHWTIGRLGEFLKSIGSMSAPRQIAPDPKTGVMRIRSANRPQCASYEIGQVAVEFVRRFACNTMTSR